MLYSPRLIQLVCVAAFLLWSSAGEGAKRAKKRAPKAPAACVSAYTHAVQLHQSGELLEARKVIATCALGKCGALKRKCVSRSTLIKNQLPTVVAVVTDAKGDPVADVEVTMDGQMLVPEANGRAIPVNPGVHEFSFSDANGVIGKQKVKISRGERNFRVSVSQR